MWKRVWLFLGMLDCGKQITSLEKTTTLTLVTVHRARSNYMMRALTSLIGGLSRLPCFLIPDAS
jgi:hypothetical protein